MNTPKAIVFFQEQIVPARIGSRALLRGITGHPRLGDCDNVYTTTVEDIRNNGETIETCNTIYRKLTG